MNTSSYSIQKIIDKQDQKIFLHFKNLLNLFYVQIYCVNSENNAVIYNPNHTQLAHYFETELHQYDPHLVNLPNSNLHTGYSLWEDARNEAQYNSFYHTLRNSFELGNGVTFVKNMDNGGYLALSMCSHVNQPLNINLYFQHDDLIRSLSELVYTKIDSSPDTYKDAMLSMSRLKVNAKEEHFALTSCLSDKAVLNRFLQQVALTV